MSNTTKSYVDQVLGSIELIRSYTSEVSQEAFLKSTEKQDAVLHRIFTISEAVKRISAQTKKKHDQIPWKAISELPKSAIQNDVETNGDALWDLVQSQIPEYAKSLDQLINPPRKRTFGPKMFRGDDVREVAKNLLGCTLHFPKAVFPVKQGVITNVQWFDTEDKDTETTEDKQGDALLMEPGRMFIFESIGNVVLLISALNENTRSCVRINAVQGVADKPHMFVRALGITSFDRDRYQGLDILDQNNPLYITEAEIEVPEPEVYTPHNSKYEKGLKITL
ncbi:MAG: DUF86 domain-containing protein [SAR324 cluster bacterium]|nr:DUF86 domain-containing protein [SAR324 cluster bacterium]